METSDGIGEKAGPALCITMKLPAITQFLLTVAAGHYIVKLLGNEPPRHTKHDAAAHFFKKPRRARARRQKIRARSAALFFHGGISDQHRPAIGAGLGDHQHPDQRDGVRPQHHRDIKAEAQHDGEPHPAGRYSFQKRKNQNLLYSTRQRNAAKRSGGSRSSLFSQTHTMRKAPKVRKL